MSALPLRALSANLGCASPSAVSVERREAARRWAARVRATERPHLVFAQEVPDGDWLTGWEADGWHVSPTEGPSYRVRSALLWCGVDDRGPLDLPTAAYHGSYVSGRKLAIPGLEREVAVLSVHASPSPVSPDDLTTWAAHSPLPVARDRREGAADGTLWDSDMVVATCRMLAEQLEVLAVGDLNECLAWDHTHTGEWGERFYGAVRAGGVLDLPLHREWSGERRTYFARGREPYQLDHALATPSVARLVRSATVDPTWDEAAAERGELSDHAPIRFRLG